MLTLTCKCDGRSKKDQHSKVHVTPHLHLNRCATVCCDASPLPVQRHKGLDVPTSSAGVLSSAFSSSPRLLAFMFSKLVNLEDTDASQQSGTQQRSDPIDVQIKKAYLSDWVPMTSFCWSRDPRMCGDKIWEMFGGRCISSTSWSNAPIALLRTAVQITYIMVLTHTLKHYALVSYDPHDHAAILLIDLEEVGLCFPILRRIVS